MTETHEYLWHEWYDHWHNADASKPKPSYEEWLEDRILLMEKMAIAEFLRAELYHSHLEDGCVMGPGVIAATEEARRVRIQDVVDDAHLLPDV